MNKYLFELLPYMPQISKDSSNNSAKKLDKISILKMAVEHMKYLKSMILNNYFIDTVFL